MQDSSFKIYNASAGSGKTFTLAKSYIKLLVAAKHYDQFKYILAITFTNKAVGEMKTRIIDMLTLFSKEEDQSPPHPMFTAICDELSISADFLKKKSKHILKHIIHNYGAFEISTIDGFTHRVIRTFAHDLNLPVNFEVELDQDRLLNEAVDRLIAKAGDDKILTNVLVDFAIEKTEDDRSWDISLDFNKIAKLLVSENHAEALNTFKGKTIEEFKALKSQLSQSIIQLEKDIVSEAKKILTLIEECGLEYEDFSGKYLPKYFINISEKKLNISFNSAWQNNLIEGGALYPKRVSVPIAETIDSVQPAITDAFLKTKDQIFNLKFKKGLHRNITPLSVLNAISKELREVKEEQNQMLISEFNKIISAEIKDQPTPFIYERLGEKFKHYFIDEFQDTSRMQWTNLIPLLDNALSAANGSAMVVGDAKQAIYRWRGGEAEQFIDLYNEKDNPFQIKPEVLSLDTNYRSAAEIINFNNGFFEYLGEQFFSNPDYAQLYVNAKQKTHSNSEGYLNFNFLDISQEDDKNEVYANEVYNTIKNCLESNYNLDDICIIVRKKKDGVAIANFLTDRGIKITSSETLLLTNSKKVLFIDAFLKLLIQPENDGLKIEILSFLADELHVNDKHHFFKSHLKPNLEELFESLRIHNILLNKSKLLGLPLYELVETVLRSFNLHNDSDAYIQYYLDTVMEFTQKYNSDLASFISYFEKKKTTLSVISPQNMNAVEIMTIHKSKGLEFPVVIFPFADLDIYKEIEPKIWYSVDGGNYNGFSKLLLNYNKDVEHYGDIGKQIFDEHQAKLELDNINLLYVVMTRAISQLYVISKKDISSKGVINKKSYAGMFIKYLQHLGLWNDSQCNYSFGNNSLDSTSSASDSTTEQIQLISVPKEDHDISIVTKSGQLWDTKQEMAIERGNLVHLVLSKVKTPLDLDFAIDELLNTGIIKKTDQTELQDLVLNVINHEKLNKYFTEDFSVYNERDIISTNGQLLRPDRLNINSENEVIIIDYKTGEEKTAHYSQLNEYASVLQRMNYTVTDKLIVYVNDTIKVVEV